MQKIEENRLKTSKNQMTQITQITPPTRFHPGGWPVSAPPTPPFGPHFGAFPQLKYIIFGLKFGANNTNNTNNTNNANNTNNTFSVRQVGSADHFFRPPFRAFSQLKCLVSGLSVESKNTKNTFFVFFWSFRPSFSPISATESGQNGPFLQLNR